ncbi:unannotated protein [freshwater metagenome]|uniref:Unannotated protein n=1 Tax=freshwater metagenome TaxID=449393 RepID=A0A6J6ZVJ6_9ZZZZ
MEASTITFEKRDRRFFIIRPFRLKRRKMVFCWVGSGSQKAALLVRHRDDVAIISDDDVDTKPCLNGAQTARAAEISLEPPSAGLVEEQPLGAATTHRRAEALKQFNHHHRDAALRKSLARMDCQTGRHQLSPSFGIRRSLTLLRCQLTPATRPQLPTLLGRRQNGVGMRARRSRASR